MAYCLPKNTVIPSAEAARARARARLGREILGVAAQRVRAPRLARRGEHNAAAELEALQEIAQLQREEQEELREEIEAITVDEQRLRTLADEAAEKEKANLEAEKRTWSQKDDHAASRAAVQGVIDDDNVQGSTISSNAAYLIATCRLHPSA